MSEALGRKGCLQSSILLSFVDSIVFAIPHNMRTVIAGRVVQGLGGGAIDILTSVVLADMTTLEERAKYLGLMAIPSAVDIIIGPFDGGLFSTYVSWRWIGCIDLPLLGMGAVLSLVFLRLRAIPMGETLISNLNRLDCIGMPLVITGVTAFCVPLSRPGSLFPRASWQTLVPLNLGAAIIGVFAWYESKPLKPSGPSKQRQAIWPSLEASSMVLSSSH